MIMSDVATLIQTLSGNDGLARKQARIELEKIGEPAVASLIALLQTGQGPAVWEAAKALCNIRDPKAGPALVVTLESADPGVRWVAAEALIALGAACLEPLCLALASNPTSGNLREGAHHVLYDLINKNYLLDKYTVIARPVLAALDGAEPAVGAQGAAYDAVDALRSL
jgi:HEAT repeat protein